MSGPPDSGPLGQVALAAHPGYRFAFHGSGTSFFLIFLKNVLLTLLTLGIYLAWAKTERRRYIWHNIEFHGQHLGYTGKGLELFKGYLVVVAGYLLFIGLPALAARFAPGLAGTVEVALGIGLFLAIPALIYRSRAFLYSRTTWRGIRFGLMPGAGAYARSFLGGYLLTALTFGLYAPVMFNRLHRIITDNTRFGTLRFAYVGQNNEAFGIAIKGLLLSIVTLGLYYFWYRAEITRFRARNTLIGNDARLRVELTGAGLLGLFLLSVFGTTFSLGLAFPWITMYSFRYVAERTFVDGRIDFDAIEQRAGDAGATADGFADALDLGLGV